MLDEGLPPRLDSPLLFPAVRGGYTELGKWRDRQSGTRAAGGRTRAPAGLRPSTHVRDLEPRCGRLALHASRRMGTSLAMIDATYGHLAPDAEEQERALLDAFDAVDAGAAGENYSRSASGTRLRTRVSTRVRTSSTGRPSSRRTYRCCPFGFWNFRSSGSGRFASGYHA